MIKLKIDVKSAASIRHVLFKEQERYTYDPTCVPQRIVEIRNVIEELDKQIEENING